MRLAATKSKRIESRHMHSSAAAEISAPLTATDITAIYSIADRLQLAAEWGPLRRFTSGLMDGFVVLDPNSAGALYTIGRDRAGRYVVQDDTGRDLAAGTTIDDALAHWRS